MQVFSANIKLDDKSLMIIPKTGLTPADIHILRHLHGFNAVQNITLTGEIVRTSADERRRITLAYKPKAVMAVFPSLAYPIPQTFEDEGDPDNVLYEDTPEADKKPSEDDGDLDPIPDSETGAGDPDDLEAGPAPLEPTFGEPEAAPTAAEVEPAAPVKARGGNMAGLAKAREARAANLAAKKQEK